MVMTMIMMMVMAMVMVMVMVVVMAMVACVHFWKALHSSQHHIPSAITLCLHMCW